MISRHFDLMYCTFPFLQRVFLCRRIVGPSSWRFAVRSCHLEWKKSLEEKTVLFSSKVLKRSLPECRFRHKKSRDLKKIIIKGKALIYGYAVLSCFDLKSFLWFSKIFLWHSVKSNVLTRKDIVREGSGLDPGQLWKTRCVTWTRVADDPKLLHQFMCLEFSE